MILLNDDACVFFPYHTFIKENALENNLIIMCENFSRLIIKRGDGTMLLGSLNVPLYFTYMFLFHTTHTLCVFDEREYFVMARIK